MKSEHVDRFNHDSDAAHYDEDVKNEKHPIRAGYSELLKWVAHHANMQGGFTLELGCGTGNLSTLLNNYSDLVCVDISEKMIDLAKSKLSKCQNIIFEQADLLEFFESNQKKYDSIVSTYAVHHLTEAEKEIFFLLIHKNLNEDGVAIFGDLMFENNLEKERQLKKFLDENQPELVNDINNEFFGNLEAARKFFKSLKNNVTTQKFSDLSWGVKISKSTG